MSSLAKKLKAWLLVYEAVLLALGPYSMLKGYRSNGWADLAFLLLCPGEILDRRLKPKGVEVVREPAPVYTRARSAAHLPN